MTWYSKKILFSLNVYVCGFMSNSHKKSWTVSKADGFLSIDYLQFMLRFSIKINETINTIIPSSKAFKTVTRSHWTYWLQILSELCFQRVALSGNYEILAICTDKNTFFNDLYYKADPGQHFHKSEKSARRHHHHKIIKTNLKTLVSPLLTRT